MSSHWPQVLHQTLSDHDCVLVTVTEVWGSAPRAMGSRMIVTSDTLLGSIGGGNLEFEATALSRQLLQRHTEPHQQTLTYGLGPRLNQCCGGAVQLCYQVFPGRKSGRTHAWLDQLLTGSHERDGHWLLTRLDDENPSRWVLDPRSTSPDSMPATLCSAIARPDHAAGGDFSVLECSGVRFLLEHVQQRSLPLVLFGAGHVGTALVKALSDLPFDVTWVDSREPPDPARVPANTRFVQHENPPAVVGRRDDKPVYLVMTHSHELDEDICHKVLTGNRFTFLGLIGSATKRARFVHRLAARGNDDALLERLVCPVGNSGITGKRPATIAVSIAAQLLTDIVPEYWR